MPIVEIGCTVEEANVQSERDKITLIPGSYKLMCMEIEAGESSKGRPQLKFTFNVADHPNADFNGKKLMYWCSLPHAGSSAGIGFLLDVTTALGKPWQGASLVTEDYIGMFCTANVDKNKQGYMNIVSFV